MTTLNLCDITKFNPTNAGNILLSIKSKMEDYYKQVNGDKIDSPLLIRAFNKSVGINTANSSFAIFFQDNLFNNINNFDKTVMYNFWSNNDKTINTQESIDSINDFLINFGDRAEPKNGVNTNDPYNYFYSSFSNPYCEFIVNYLMCGMGNDNVTFNINSNNQIITNNLYRFLRGGGTGDDGGTRGSGTYTLCQYCNTYFTEYIKNNNLTGSDIYYHVAQNDNLSNFCGCCSQLTKYQPEYYEKAKDANNGVSIVLPCQPICHKNETIKAYNGNDPLVNNGYPDNKNTSLVDERTYTRRQCLSQTICVIDKINISIIGGNSQVEFNQACPGCGSEGGCICFLDLTDGSVTDTVNDFQNPVIFKQNCQTTLCSQQKQNSDGNLETVFLPCNSLNPSDTGKNPNQNYNHDGQPSPVSSQQNRDKYIFGIQNWLVPIIFVSIAIIVTLSILFVNISSIKKQIYLITPKSITLSDLKKELKKETPL